MEKKITYSDTGVDITEGQSFVENIKDLAQKTYNEKVLRGIGQFGGLFDLSHLSLKNPVLVSSTDGVGTKIKVAVAAGKHRGIGIDIVSHCINDIMVQGASPIFFLDYIGCGKLSRPVMIELVRGMSEVCQKAGCALIGGETAEMPDVYRTDEYDLVGTIVGIVDKEKIIDGSSISSGDILIGLPSSGLHTNGYTLARKIIFEIKKMTVGDTPQGLHRPVGDEILEPHRCYCDVLQHLFANFQIKGIAHITGGGLIENIPRILPAPCSVEIQKEAMPVPSIFSLLQEWGPVDEKEMYRVFNMGIGIVLVVSKKDSGSMLKAAKTFYPESNIIGEVVKGRQETILK
ncbi:MAG: phosphoribosylformylglycinamidine cyclo-ligase [Candidatus Aureabacteria bacterium]|nr:phosphoribosylformylglycinamidine cyclo-ligase [Candidatus Auribacterota bacterium]